MKAFVIEQNLSSLKELPGCLKEDAPEPKPSGKNEVIVDVYCAGLNFFDVLQVQGKYQVKPPFPFVPGAEFSGVIAKDSPIPRGCHFEPGKTRVFGAAQGSYGEKLKVDWITLIEIPDGLSFEQAAGLFITYPTSYAALVLRANVQPGETVLVHAGAGGVGLAAVQIAKALGARVIATASTADKLAVIRREGGLDADDHTLLYGGSAKPAPPKADGAKGKGPAASPNEEWQDKVKQLTEGKGVDVVYDPVGMINKSIKVAAWNCRLLVIGFAGGEIEKVPTNLLLLKNIAVSGTHWGAYQKHELESIGVVWGGLLELLRQGRLRPSVYDRIYEGLEEVPAGLTDLSTRKTWGKAVVRLRKDGSAAKASKGSSGGGGGGAKREAKL